MELSYKSTDFTFSLDGQSISCLISYGISEQTETINKVQADQKWSKSEANLQSFQIELQGFDEGDYPILKTAFDNHALLAYEIRTNDGQHLDTGQVFVTSLSRSRTASSSDVQFSATLIGFATATDQTDLSYLLQEDGDYIWQENGDRIII